jgi:hypothetical protein
VAGARVEREPAEDDEDRGPSEPEADTKCGNAELELRAAVEGLIGSVRSQA